MIVQPAVAVWDAMWPLMHVRVACNRR